VSAARIVRLFAAFVLALSATALLPPPARAEAGWRYPVEGRPDVLRGFDPPAKTWLPGHRGVDLAAGAFDPVVAAAAGEVTFAADVAGQGVVVVEHPGGLRSTYEPVTAEVSVGEHVDAGELLGRLEPLTVHCARTCLHWGVLRGATYLDPLSFVDAGPVVLLPVGAPVRASGGAGPAGWSFPNGEASWRPGATAAYWLQLTSTTCLPCLRRVA
jgi:murein DD-endopeptidase MepM/ murein hydrolase activator NlpD